MRSAEAVSLALPLAWLAWSVPRSGASILARTEDFGPRTEDLAEVRGTSGTLAGREVSTRGDSG